MIQYSKALFGYVHSFASQTIASIRADAILYLMIVSYALIGLIFLATVGADDRAAYSFYIERWPWIVGIFMPAAAISFDLFWIVHRFNRRRGSVMRKVFGPARLAHFVSGICLLIAFTVFLGTFTSVKNGLSVWQDGFPFDRVQADIDAALHFGVDPWRWLFVVLKDDTVRSVIEWNYGLGFFILCFGTLFFVVTSPRTAHLRMRYLVSYMVMWIIVGNIFAGLFMSAGPAFYGFVTGDLSRFAEQVQFLARDTGGENLAANYQAILWERYIAGKTGGATGISAFPSMHVALAVFNALFAWEHSRRLGIVATAYAVVIAASSVYLAWHYAIDGYAAAALTVLIYFAARKLFEGGKIRQGNPAWSASTNPAS